MAENTAIDQLHKRVNELEDGLRIIRIFANEFLERDVTHAGNEIVSRVDELLKEPRPEVIVETHDDGTIWLVRPWGAVVIAAVIPEQATHPETVRILREALR